MRVPAIVLWILSCLLVLASLYALFYDPVFILKFVGFSALGFAMETLYYLLAEGRFRFVSASSAVTAGLLLLIPALVCAQYDRPGSTDAQFLKIGVSPRAAAMSDAYIAVVTGGPRLGDVESGTVAALTTPAFAVVSGGLACMAGAGLLARLMPALPRWRLSGHLHEQVDDADGT